MQIETFLHNPFIWHINIYLFSAEQSRRKEYSSYIKHYDTFEDILEIEFYSKYPLNEDVEVPLAFRNNTDLPRREIAIRTLPTVSCKNHRMATFIKTGRGNIKQRELIRELVTKLGTDIQPYFVIGLGSDDIQNEINSHNLPVIAPQKL